MSEASVKTYEIGGKTYEQRELLLGQWRQISELFKDLELPAGGSRMRQLIEGLERAGKLDRALAIVLVEVGGTPRDKDLDAIEREIPFALTPQQIAEIIDDFFTCNPVSSILSRLGAVLAKVVAIVTGAMREIGSKKSASLFQVETSQGETPSSGDLLPKSASLGLEHETAS